MNEPGLDMFSHPQSEDNFTETQDAVSSEPKKELVKKTKEEIRKENKEKSDKSIKYEII